MTFVLRPAVRERTSLLIALAGPTGCGKTYSALRLATGLAATGQGRIAFIDTEAGRGLHYADFFRFDHGDLLPPFRPDAYREAIVECDKAGYDVIVIDSMSHEYEGDGGLQDWAAKLEADGVRSPGNWKEPKTAHKRMVSRLLQCRAHLIFCLRAEEKMLVKQETDPQTGRKKTVVIPAADRPLLERWQPLTEKRFLYETTASFLLLPDAPGVPRPVKLQEQHHFAFPPGEPITEATGEALGKWAHGGAVTQRSTNAEAQREAADAAERGTDALRDWWKGASKAARAAVQPTLDDLKRRAAEADASGTDDDPFAAADPDPQEADHAAWAAGWQGAIERAETDDDLSALEADLKAEIDGMPAAARPGTETAKPLFAALARRRAELRGALV